MTKQFLVCEAGWLWIEYAPDRGWHWEFQNDDGCAIARSSGSFEERESCIEDAYRRLPLPPSRADL
jgi:hypothetical protein